MIKRSVRRHFRWNSAPLESEPRPRVRKVREVYGLTDGHVEDVSVSVAVGDVVGFAELLERGQDEVIGMILGATARTSGRLPVDGSQPLADSSRAIKLGLAFCHRIGPCEQPSQRLTI